LNADISVGEILTAAHARPIAPKGALPRSRPDAIDDRLLLIPLGPKWVAKVSKTTGD
jgi:hypothetical protein